MNFFYDPDPTLTKEKFKKLDIMGLVNECEYRAGFYDLWQGRASFILSLRGKNWEQLSYKQVNWLQQILKDLT